MAKITVILPVYNGANYLKSSIDSVLAQEFEDFELHVLDDGSSDASPTIAQSTGDSRVRYSRNSARYGLFKTLNRGFAEAKTSLVRIWSHDDVMLPGSLAEFASFADSHPSVGMVYCDFFEIDADGKRTNGEQRYICQRERTPAVAHPDISALLFLCFGCLPGNISTVMLRREAWLTVNGFLEGMQQAPDYEMWVRISETRDIGFLSNKLIELRSHPLQLGRVGSKQMTTIEEELLVYDHFKRRLTNEFTLAELHRFWRCHRGRQHAHWVFRAILRRDWTSVARGWAALRKYGACGRQFLRWMLSANGRFFTPNQAHTFDLKVRKLSPTKHEV